MSGCQEHFVATQQKIVRGDQESLGGRRERWLPLAQKGNAVTARRAAMKRESLFSLSLNRSGIQGYEAKMCNPCARTDLLPICPTAHLFRFLFEMTNVAPTANPTRSETANSCIFGWA